jgi:hypothetical protein
MPRRCAGSYVAFQVVGDGPPDLVFMAEGASNVEFAWEVPAYERVFRRLATFGRLIRFDARGSGLSDPLGRSEQLARGTGEGHADRARRGGRGAGSGGGEQHVGIAGDLLRCFISEPRLFAGPRWLLCAIGPCAGLPLGSTSRDTRQGDRWSRRPSRLSGARAEVFSAQCLKDPAFRGAVAAPYPVDVVWSRWGEEAGRNVGLL